MQKRPIFNVLLKRLQEPRKFIQVLLGPRQVGKTTLALLQCINLMIDIFNTVNKSEIPYCKNYQDCKTSLEDAIRVSEQRKVFDGLKPREL